MLKFHVLGFLTCKEVNNSCHFFLVRKRVAQHEILVMNLLSEFHNFAVPSVVLRLAISAPFQTCRFSGSIPVLLSQNLPLTRDQVTDKRWKNANFKNSAPVPWATSVGNDLQYVCSVCSVRSVARSLTCFTF